MSANPRVWLSLCLLALVVCQRGHGQESRAISRVEAVVIPGASYADITFFENVKASSAERVSLYSLGDGADETRVGASPAEGLGGRPRMLRVYIADNLPAGHTKLRVCLGSVEAGSVFYKNLKAFQKC